VPSNFDPMQDIVATPTLLTFNLNNRAATFRIGLSRMDTGEPVGHYPPRTVWIHKDDPFDFPDLLTHRFERRR
jgi:hypothetical protein